jgi:uncharacterized protein (TIGR02284 family)
MINDYEATHDITDENFKLPSDGGMDDQNVITTLNGLIEICRDGQNGFKEAAEGVERSDLKSVFYEFSQQRAEFVGVLQQLVRSLGGEPAESGSITGALHRSWIDIKSAVSGRDEAAILNECERGEDAAKDAYEAAQNQDLPANVADVVRQQAQAVLAAHNRIKALRNSESHSAGAV